MWRVGWMPIVWGKCNADHRKLWLILPRPKDTFCNKLLLQTSLRLTRLNMCSEAMVDHAAVCFNNGSSDHASALKPLQCHGLCSHDASAQGHHVCECVCSCDCGRESERERETAPTLWPRRILWNAFFWSSPVDVLSQLHSIKPGAYSLLICKLSDLGLLECWQSRRVLVSDNRCLSI